MVGNGGRGGPGLPLVPNFVFFVHDLAIEIKKEKKGVRYGKIMVTILLYADDMVLMAETREGLQRLLDVAARYSEKWRFRFNVGEGKTEVMVFHGVRDTEWFGKEGVDGSRHVPT